jgi:hypothetical protein
MYLCIVPGRQSQRHSLGFPEHSTLSCPWALVHAFPFSLPLEINGIFQQSPAQEWAQGKGVTELPGNASAV